jgi:serine/threonine-protein kinase
VTEREEFSTDVPKGKVIGTDPPVGTQLPSGSALTLIVSKGPKTFDMPNVTGLSSEDARKLLEGLGLHVTQVQVPGSIGDTVVGQKPDPGTKVAQGDDVTIYVGG